MPSRDRWFPVLVWLAVAAGLWIVATISAAHLPFYTRQAVTRTFPDQPWFDAWIRWDSGWYRLIADRGYWFTPGQQSPVAFFPAYPLLMRAGALVTGSSVVAGIFVTLGAGLGIAVLFHRWCAARLPSGSARTALLALLLYPFGVYLFGAVYSDALFLLGALAAFTLLDLDRPWTAGLAGAVATATRPVGFSLVAALWLRAVERRVPAPETAGGGGAGLPEPQVPVPPPQRLGSGLRRLSRRDAPLLLAPLGLVLYCVYLWARFGDPLAFSTAIAAPGWNQPPGPATWLKLDFFRTFGEIPPLKLGHLRLLVHLAVTVGALGLVPAVIRRFGWAYGLYVLLVVGFPAVSSKDFMGMGRYVLAAFPCFAAAGDLLASRPRLVRPVLAASAAALAAFTALQAVSFQIA